VPELEACWSQRHGVVAALCQHIIGHDTFASDGIAMWHSAVRPLLRDLIANHTLLSSKTSGGSYVGDIHSDRYVGFAHHTVFNGPGCSSETLHCSAQTRSSSCAHTRPRSCHVATLTRPSC
jgi:hypothetical protein